MIYKNLFLAFFRVGMLGYGGGPAAIPLVHKETVEIYEWMTAEEFSDLLAMANTLPGPICTKLAGQIGYRVGKKIGMLTALAATTIPTVLLMILLMSMLSIWRDVSWVNGLTFGILPVVSVMMLQMTWTLLKQSKKTFGILITAIHIAIAVVLLQVLGIHPAIVILALLGSAFLPYEKWKGGEKK